MKKLLTTLLATLMVATLGGTSVFAQQDPWTDVGTVTTSNGSVETDINYSATDISDDTKDGTPAGNVAADDVKAAIYVTVESKITNGTVNVNHTYSQQDGIWTESKTLADKTAGTAQFKITNYSYDGINAQIQFEPVITVAKRNTKCDDDYCVNVVSAFDGTFGTTTWEVPTAGESEESDVLTIDFIDELSVEEAEKALSAAQKMGTFKVTIGRGANGPQ